MNLKIYSIIAVQFADTVLYCTHMVKEHTQVPDEPLNKSTSLACRITPGDGQNKDGVPHHVPHHLTLFTMVFPTLFTMVKTVFPATFFTTLFTMVFPM